MIDDIIKFQPDLVVIVFCLGNDFTDNVLYQRYGYYKPYAALDKKGNLVIKGYPLPNIRKFGFNGNGQIFGSLLLAEIRNKFLVSGLQQAGLLGFSNDLMHANPQSLTPNEKRVKSEGILINERILAGIRDSLDKYGVPLIITSAHSKQEYNKSRRYGHQGYYPSVERTLVHSTDKLGIVSVSNVNNLNGRDFWVRDGHWNPSGHQKMATSLAKLISEKGYLTAFKVLQPTLNIPR